MEEIILIGFIGTVGFLIFKKWKEDIEKMEKQTEENKNMLKDYTKYDNIIKEQIDKYFWFEISKEYITQFIKGIIMNESSFKEDIPDTIEEGDKYVGVMQVGILACQTVTNYDLRCNLENLYSDKIWNINVGIHYLNWLMKYYVTKKFNTPFDICINTAICYNWRIDYWQDYLEGKRQLPEETQDYIDKLKIYLGSL